MSPKNIHLILALSLNLLAGCRSIFTKTSYPEFVFTADLQHNKDDAFLTKGISKKIIIENLAGHVYVVSNHWCHFMRVTVCKASSYLWSVDCCKVNHYNSWYDMTTDYIY